MARGLSNAQIAEPLVVGETTAAPSRVLGVLGAKSSATPGSVAGGTLASGSGPASPDGASGLAGIIARVVALVSGSGALVLTVCYLLQVVRRRRRGRGTAT